MKTIFTILAFLTIVCSYSQTSDDSSFDDLTNISYEDAGFNRDSIEKLIDLISTTPNKDFRGVVVIKDNQIVMEEYFNTFWRNTIHDIRSAGKSVTALLLGVAIREGLIKSVDENIYDLFSQNKGLNVNKDYKKIKLRHVLDMSSGLDADSDYPSTPGQAGHWIGKDDWKEYLLNVPLVNTPGEKFAYADINAVLVGMAIEEASGMSLKDYAKEKLFDPLGIEQVYWYTNKANQTGAAGNLYITTLDFAKLGMLINYDGKWGSTQLIDPEYIATLVNTKKPEIADWFFMADTYGMFWYKSTRSFAGRNSDLVFASGNGGNQLIVIPEQNMVVALTSSAYGPIYGHGRSYAILEKILSALE